MNINRIYKKLTRIAYAAGVLFLLAGMVLSTVSQPALANISATPTPEYGIQPVTNPGLPPETSDPKNPVTVPTTSPMTCSFDVNPQGDMAPVTVSFKNTSVNAATFSWDFGNGQFSSEVAPSTVYSDPGYYNIILTCYDADGNGMKADGNFSIDSSPARPAALFETQIDPANPLSVTFIDASQTGGFVYNTSQIVSWNWDFGDGTQATGQGPHTHVYTKPGVYIATLIVTDSNGNTGFASQNLDTILIPHAPDLHLKFQLLTDGCGPNYTIRATLENWNTSGVYPSYNTRVDFSIASGGGSQYVDSISPTTWYIGTLLPTGAGNGVTQDITITTNANWLSAPVGSQIVLAAHVSYTTNLGQQGGKDYKADANHGGLIIKPANCTPSWGSDLPPDQSICELTRKDMNIPVHVWVNNVPANSTIVLTKSFQVLAPADLATAPTITTETYTVAAATPQVNYNITINGTWPGVRAWDTDVRTIYALTVTLNGTVLGSSSRTYTWNPQICPPPPPDVTPVLECVDANSDGTFTAHFGYNNTNPAPVTILVGSRNYFTPAPQDQGQPTSFDTGRKVDVFTVDFNSGSLVWTLAGQNATASNTSKRCNDGKLSLEISGPAESCGPITYTATLTNTGLTGTVSGVVVVFSLLNGSNYVTNPGSQTWNVGSITAGQTLTHDFTLTTNSDWTYAAQSSQIQVRAAVTQATPFENNLVSDDATVNHPASCFTVQPLVPSVYCQDIHDNGEVDATFQWTNPNVVTTKDIAVGPNNNFSDGVDHGQPTHFAANSNGSFDVTFTGASLTWFLDGNSATAGSSNPTIPACNNTPDVKLTVSMGDDTSCGPELTLPVTVTNTGRDAAHNVVVDITTLSGSQYIASLSATQLDFGDVAPGASETQNIAVTVTSAWLYASGGTQFQLQATLPGWGSDTGNGTNPGGCYQSVQPSVVCQDVHDDGSVTARFGWTNPNATLDVDLAIGPTNNFSDGVDHGQPTHFAAANSGHFDVDFTLASLTWFLDGNSATADKSNPNIPACNSTPDVKLTVSMGDDTSCGPELTLPVTVTNTGRDAAHNVVVNITTLSGSQYIAGLSDTQLDFGDVASGASETQNIVVTTNSDWLYASGGAQFQLQATLPGWGSDTGNGTNPGGCYQPLQPSVVCQDIHSDGSVSARFGWTNPNATLDVDLAIGPNNNFSDGVNHGQPTHFDAAGSDTFDVDFTGAFLTWNLDGNSATADKENVEIPACNNNPEVELSVSMLSPEGCGPELTFPVTVTNNGRDDAHNVVVDITTLSGSEWIDSINLSQLDFGDVAAGGSETLNVVVMANSAWLHAASGVTIELQATLPGWGSDTGTAENPGDCTEYQPLQPSVLCQDVHDDGSVSARFKWTNTNDVAVTRLYGPMNEFTPGDQNQGQPTTFAAQSDGTVTVSFTGDTLTWNLDGNSAIAEKNNPQIPACNDEPNVNLAVVVLGSESCGPDLVFPVSITNSGSDTATNVSAVLSVISGEEYIDTISAMSLTFGDIAPGATETQIITVTVNASWAPVAGATVELEAVVNASVAATRIAATINPRSRGRAVNPGNCSVEQPVTPSAVCVDQTATGYTARFGYTNPNAAIVTIPVGPDNYFTPGDQDLGQPSDFQTGTHTFEVAFDGNLLTWHLGLLTASASSQSPRCTTPEPHIEITMTGGGTSCEPAFTVKVKNTGQADSGPLTVDISIPVGSQYVDLFTPTVWHIDNLTPGSQTTNQIVIQVNNSYKTVTGASFQVKAVIASLNLSAIGTATNPGNCIPLEPIVPTAVCVDQTSTGYMARFAYNNPNAVVVNLPIGPDNYFTPGDQDRGQPSDFQTGSHNFDVEFDGSLLTWHLGSLTASASSQTPRCTPQPNLSIRVSGGGDSCEPKFTITVENTGQADSGALTVDISIPVGSEYVTSYSPTTWNIPNVPAGTTVSQDVTIVVNDLYKATTGASFQVKAVIASLNLIGAGTATNPGGCLPTITNPKEEPPSTPSEVVVIPVTGGEPTPVPTLAPPAVVDNAEILIPVTGVDRTQLPPMAPALGLLQKLAFNLSLVFLGMAFIFNGLSKRHSA